MRVAARPAPGAAPVSLLDEGDQDVTIYPMIQTDGPDGEKVWRAAPDNQGVPILASVQPIGNDKPDEPSGGGQQVDTVYRVRPNRDESVPVGPWAGVGWDGRRWDVVGDPAVHSGSDSTAHRAFRIKARKAAGI